jgi:hypothetical protein
MEQLLQLWIDDLNKKVISLTQRAVTAKARSHCDEIKQKSSWKRNIYC